MTSAPPPPGRPVPGGAPPGGPAPGRLFWAAAAAGWAVMAAGAWGLVADAGRTRPADAVRFLLGLAAAHDLLVAPTVVLAGWAVARAVPAPARAPVQAALVVSAVVGAFAFPFVRGYGRITTNPSILPRDYGRGTLVLLAAVWAAAAAGTVVRWRRGRVPGAGLGASATRRGRRAGPDVVP